MNQLKKFAQIFNSKVHWIFESEEKPKFATNIILIEITNLEIQPEEGWEYSTETEQCTRPSESIGVEPLPTIEEEVLFETKYQTMLLEMSTLL